MLPSSSTSDDLELLHRLESVVPWLMVREALDAFDILRRWMDSGAFEPRDLIDWGQKFLPHYFTHPPSEMHRWLAEELEQSTQHRGRRRAIVAPRSGAKTTFLSKLFPLYCICNGLERYLLLVGDSTEQALQNLLAIRQELESNEALAAAYPHVCGMGPVWTSRCLVTRNGIKIEALGAGKKLRGRTFGPHRPGLVVVDDLENDQSVRSAGRRETTWNWFSRALMYVGTAETNVFVVGTALHPEDLLQRLKRTAGWHVRTFASLISEPSRGDLWDQWRTVFCDFSRDLQERETSARAFYVEHQAEMNDGASVLWPEREPLYDLMVYREVNGELAFRAEKQGDAQATGNTEWPAEYFSRSIWFSEWPDLLVRVMALDPSKGQNEKNDYSAYVMAGLAQDGKIYIDADISRRDAGQVVDDGINLLLKFHPQVFGVETNQFLQLFETMFQRESRRRGYILPIQRIHNNIDKIVRIRGLTPHLRSGNLRFKSGSRGAELLVEQLKTFPANQHDDGPDALQMAMSLLASLTNRPRYVEERVIT